MKELNDSQKRTELYTRSIIIAICVFFSGFIMLNLIWIHWKVANPDSCLPGLYAYKAATIGDGFCLPLLVFSTSCYSFLHRIESNEIRKKARRKSCLIGAASAFVGLMIQISWLTREGGQHNWTIPEDHHFNYAGWYHAVFFVCMFGVIAFFLAELFQSRKYGAQDLNRVDHLLFGVFSFSASYYVMLQRLDDMSVQYPSALIIIGSGIVVFMAIALLIFLSDRNNGLLMIGFCFSSIVLAAGLAFLSKNHNLENIVYPVCIFFLSFSFLEPENKAHWVSIKGFFEQFFFISFPVFIFNCVYLSDNNDNRFNIISILCIFLIPLNNYILLTKKNNRQSMPIFGVFSQHRKVFSFQVIILVAIGIVSGYLPLTDDPGPIFDIALSAAFFFIGRRCILQIFDGLIKEEKKVLRGKKKQEALLDIRLFTYGKIIMIVVGMLIFLVCAPSGIIQVTSIECIINIHSDIRRRIAVCLFLIAILFSMLFIDIELGSGIFHRSKKNSQKDCWGSSILFGIVYLISIYCIYLVNKPYSLKLNIVYLCSVFQIIGCSALVAESFYSNIYGIRDVDKKKDFSLNSIIVFLGSMIFLVFTIMPSNGPVFCLEKGVLNVGVIIIGIVGNILVLVVYPCLLFFATYPIEVVKSDNSLEGPEGEVAKNGFLALMIAFLAGEMPVYISLVNKKLIFTLLAVVALVFSLYEFVTYCIEKNVEHLEEQEKKAKNNIENGKYTYDSEKKRITDLKNHLKRQNAISLFSLLLYCIIPSISVYLGSEKKEDNGIVDLMMNKYIPKLHYFKDND